MAMQMAMVMTHAIVMVMDMVMAMDLGTAMDMVMVIGHGHRIANWNGWMCTITITVTEYC